MSATDTSHEILKRQIQAILAESDKARVGDDPFWAIAASDPGNPTARGGERAAPESVADAEPAELELPLEEPQAGSFEPRLPQTMAEVGLSQNEIESLVLKFLLHVGSAAGRTIADQVRLPFPLLEPLLQELKSGRVLVYKSAASMGDYIYELTDIGGERARRYLKHCSYFGAAPVRLDAYVRSIRAQSLSTVQVDIQRVRKAFSDLQLTERILRRIAQAMTSAKGLFLYGAPGNGKSSIAERISRAYGDNVWIPRAISIWGEIVRVFDPSCHEVVAMPGHSPDQATREIDRRWVLIRRPTIIVGGELTLENLEITTNRLTGIGEAPLQMKSNCGTLVIDDFGRQRVSPTELLNRWIVPLEKRLDYLSLMSGRKIEIPFDQMIVFSTNLEPGDLVDEAFTRRIPYKIQVHDPTPTDFRTTFHKVARELNIKCDDSAIDYLIQRHYETTKRPMRFCHPRDLLRQVIDYCSIYQVAPAMTPEAIDAAVENYFCGW